MVQDVSPKVLHCFFLTRFPFFASDRFFLDALARRFPLFWRREASQDGPPTWSYVGPRLGIDF